MFAQNFELALLSLGLDVMAYLCCQVQSCHLHRTHQDFQTSSVINQKFDALLVAHGGGRVQRRLAEQLEIR